MSTLYALWQGEIMQTESFSGGKCLLVTVTSDMIFQSSALPIYTLMCVCEWFGACRYFFTIR